MVRIILALAGLALATSSVLAAEPIEGSWKTAGGETAVIAPCADGFCITLKTGPHAGKLIGKLKGAGSSYSGEITDPNDDKTYSGSSTITGDSMELKGCVLLVLCKAQTWTRL